MKLSKENIFKAGVVTSIVAILGAAAACDPNQTDSGTTTSAGSTEASSHPDYLDPTKTLQAMAATILLDYKDKPHPSLNSKAKPPYTIALTQLLTSSKGKYASLNEASKTLTDGYPTIDATQEVGVGLEDHPAIGPSAIPESPLFYSFTKQVDGSWDATERMKGKEVGAVVNSSSEPAEFDTKLRNAQEIATDKVTPDLLSLMNVSA